MNNLFAYFCPVCGDVEIVATRRVGAYHKALGLWGWKTHAMLEAGNFPSSLSLDEIKSQVLKKDWNGGVREIESVSTDTVGVRYEKATQPRIRRKRVRVLH
jgi:hypothetical protein